LPVMRWHWRRLMSDHLIMILVDIQDVRIRVLLVLLLLLLWSHHPRRELLLLLLLLLL